MTFPTTVAVAGQPAGWMLLHRAAERSLLQANQCLDRVVWLYISRLWFVVDLVFVHVRARIHICVFLSIIWSVKWQLLFRQYWSRCNDETGSACECMCINIGISPNLIHITWPTWMRIVPCRVVCYYKFNVKSGSKKMREGGLGIWNGSIHLPFLLVSKCAQRKRKKQGEKSWSRRRGIILYQTTRWSLFHPLVWYKWLSSASVIAFISEDMEDWSYVPVASHSCSQSSFLEENSIYFWQSFTDALLFLYHLWRKHMCDHGQGFPFLKCLLPLLPCQCVSEENDSWKRPLFRSTLSMETGP